MGYSIKRTARLSLAAMMSVAVLSVGTPVVAAEPIVTGNIAGMNPATIDVNRDVKLTIVKPQTDESTGVDVEGAVFEVGRLEGYSVNDPSAWDQIRGLTSEQAAELSTDTESSTTNAVGKAIFTNLKPGVYFVRELPSRMSGLDSYRYAEPFVIVLPVADEKTKQWKYDVTIHPKAQPENRTKPKPPNEPTPGSSVTVLIPFLPLIPLIVGGFLFGSYSGAAVAPPVTPSPVPTPTPQPEPKLKKGIAKTFSRLPQTGSPVAGTFVLALLISGFGALLLASRHQSVSRTSASRRRR